MFMRQRNGDSFFNPKSLEFDRLTKHFQADVTTVLAYHWLSSQKRKRREEREK